MPNPNILYQRGNYALQTLVAERIAKWGKPARYSEYVTGYGTGGITGHNADINGVVHAVDIFVGPGNLSQAQGIELSEILRAEGKRGKIPGHPDRLAYIIHRGQIAGDHTNWEWIPYTGADWHGDHIHISSVFDYYWGDRVAGDPLDYDNTAPWGLSGASTAKPLGTTKPAPIQEDWFDMATKNDVKDALREIFAENGSGTAAAKKAGTRDWVLFNTREHAMAANNGTKANGTVLATIVAQTAALKALAESKPGLDASAVQASIDKAVQSALKDLTVTLSVDADQ